MSSLERNLRILGITMLLGAIFDWAMATWLLFLPAQTAAFLGVSNDRLILHLCGLLLTIPALFYLMAFGDTKRNVIIVAMAIVVRACQGAFFVVHVLLLAAPGSWLAIGLLNLGFAAIHLTFFKLSDFDFWPILRRAGNPPL